MNMQNASYKNTPMLSVRLKAARVEAGLSQADLSEKIGIDQSTLSRIENGQRPRRAAMESIVSFVEQHEKETPDEIEAILNVVRESPELRALVKRIQAAR